jgi:hypothetical protein
MGSVIEADANVSDDRRLNPRLSLSEYSCGFSFSFFKLHGLCAVRSWVRLIDYPSLPMAG